MKRAAALLLLLGSVPTSAAAQRIELAPVLIGMTTSTSLDRRAAGIQELAIRRSATFGMEGTYFVFTHVGLEGLWVYRLAAIRMSTPQASADLLTFETHQLHGVVTYRLLAAERSWQPFAFAGFGATFFGEHFYDNEWKPSWTAGAGITWFADEHFGLRLRARYAPTDLHDASSTFCNPFGFCQNTLTPLDIAGGVAFRF